MFLFNLFAVVWAEQLAYQFTFSSNVISMTISNKSLFVGEIGAVSIFNNYSIQKRIEVPDLFTLSVLGKYLFIGDNYCNVLQYDTMTGLKVRTFAPSLNSSYRWSQPTSSYITVDSNKLYVGYLDNSINAFNIFTGSKVLNLVGHTGTYWMNQY